MKILVVFFDRDELFWGKTNGRNVLATWKIGLYVQLVRKELQGGRFLEELPLGDSPVVLTMKSTWSLIL